MHDLYSNLKPVLIAGPLVADADQEGQIDLLGFESCLLTMDTGIGGITFTSVNRIDYRVQHSDDAATGFVDVTDDDIQGVTGITGGIVHSIQALHAAASVFRCGYKGPRRHVKLTAVFAGTHASGTPITTGAMMGDAHVRPVG